MSDHTWLDQIGEVIDEIEPEDRADELKKAIADWAKIAISATRELSDTVPLEDRRIPALTLIEMGDRMQRAGEALLSQVKRKQIAERTIGSCVSRREEEEERRLAAEEKADAGTVVTSPVWAADASGISTEEEDAIMLAAINTPDEVRQ